MTTVTTSQARPLPSSEYRYSFSLGRFVGAQDDGVDLFTADQMREYTKPDTEKVHLAAPSSSKESGQAEDDDVAAVIACLGDDAAQIRHELANCRPNGEGFICEEWAENMERAAILLQELVAVAAPPPHAGLDESPGGA